MKIWTWLLPNELPSSTALNLLVGSNYCIIEVYKELPIDEITNWLSRNAVDNVLIVPILNDMEPALPEYFLYVYFKNSADACYFKLRWK
ncbi:MAG: hypothetical protein HC836_10500 [Richelia sp. RM2_1_2]|nr:hypothetical protein [Richelia sp. RM2_1_2]